MVGFYARIPGSAACSIVAKKVNIGVNIMYGFLRACACVPSLTVADVTKNVEAIKAAVDVGREGGAQVILFPELALTGYSCADLFQQDRLLDAAWEGLQDLAKQVEEEIVVVGVPVRHGPVLLNCAAILNRGAVFGLVPKAYIPNYKEFYEARWFKSGVDLFAAICSPYLPQSHGVQIFSPGTVFDVRWNGKSSFKFGVEICEDLWVPLPPSTSMALDGATLILNPSASNEVIGKADYRRELVSQNASRNVLAYLYCSAGPKESTTDVVFSGHAIASEYGTILAESDLFSREATSFTYVDFDLERLDVERRKLSTFGDQVARFGTKQRLVSGLSVTALESVLIQKFTRYVDSDPFVPKSVTVLHKRASEIFAIQSNGLATRLEACHAKTVVVGVSGGLDSTLALLVAVKAFDLLEKDRKDIIGITMPGFGTTDKTKSNSFKLMEALGVTAREIPIGAACEQHFKDIGLDPADRSVTYENTQARERTQVLMDVANMTGGLVLGTGDLSEAALGWCTYNGDHISMYNVNCSIPKTLVKFLVFWVSNQPEFETARSTLDSIAHTTISPELLPPDEKGEIKQSTEDSIGPYALHDFFLYNVIRWGFSPKKVLFLAERAFNGEWDRQEIAKWLRVFYKRFFAAQFKRSCVPDGPKVGSISLSPRGDWRMPSDASVEEFLKEVY